MTNKIHAYPGCYLIEPLEEKADLLLTSEKKDRILKGTILEIGDKVISDGGAEIKPFSELAAGDTLYFLSYEGGYDYTVVNNRKFYFVKFQDARGYEK